jgi:hypothetical protein
VAKWLGMDVLVFNQLNPRFDILVTSEEYTLRLPADKMEYFVANRAQILSESIQFLLSNQPDEAENYPQEIRMLDLRRSGTLSGKL